MDKDTKSTSSASPRSEAKSKPIVEMTFHDIAVSRRIMNDGNNDGSKFEYVSENNGWRQYNFYFSIKQDGRYIDPSSFKVINDGDFNYKDFPDENLFLISSKNGYQTRAYLWPMSQTSTVLRFWPDSKYSQQVITSNGDKHAFCITYITFFSLRPCTYTDSRPIHVEFMIDSNKYSFCPSYFIPNTIKDLEDLVKSNNDDDHVVEKLIEFNSSVPVTPKPYKSTSSHKSGLVSGDLFNIGANTFMGAKDEGVNNVGYIYNFLGGSNMKDGNYFEYRIVDGTKTGKLAYCPVQYGKTHEGMEYDGTLRLCTLAATRYDDVPIRNLYTTGMDATSLEEAKRGFRLRMQGGFIELDVQHFVPVWYKNAFYIWQPLNDYGADFSGYVTKSPGSNYLTLSSYKASEQDSYLWQFREAK